MYRYILATLTALGFALGFASAATAADRGEFLRVYPTCKSSAGLTNSGHKTCQTTATHYRTGKTRHPVLTTFKDGCHVSTWRVEHKTGPTKGEAFKAVCWERGRFVTYEI